jgi:hypothetical protein
MNRRNTNLKKPGVTSEYTQMQILELTKCAMDPIYFIENYCKIVHPMHGVVNFNLYDYQKRLIELFHKERYSITCAARQVGKSQSACAFLLWYAIFNRHKTILVVSNKSSGAKEMVNRIVFMYEQLPDWLKPGIDENEWNKHTIAFDNGSKIISEATTVNSGRGLAISLLFCDETAFVPHNIADEFWTSISPTLTTGGAVIICSTPNGATGLFAELWHGAVANVNGFKHSNIAWNEPPGRDDKFAADQIAKIGNEKWRQEYLCEFIHNDPTLFNSTFISRYPITKPQSVDSKGIKIFDDIVTNGTYIIGLDPATGVGNDFTVITVFSFPRLVQIMEYHANDASTTTTYNILKYILRQFKVKQCTVYWSFENNGIGEGIVSLYENDEFNDYGELISDAGKQRVGMYTTSKSKMKACITLKNLLENHKLTINSKMLLNEMQNYIRKNNTYMARSGSHDDCISALLIVMRIMDELLQYEDEAMGVLYGTNDIIDYENEDDFDDVTDVNELPGIFGGTGNDMNNMDVFRWNLLI